MSEDMQTAITNAVYPVLDPHMGISIVDMGLLDEINVEGDEVEIVLKPTNPGCMSVTRIAVQVKELASTVDGVEKVKIKIIDHTMADAINEMINKD
ncbi:iron-sulfur cluster assembly protein [Methanobrevibacter sp.]